MNAEIEKEFKNTCRILLGTELPGMLDEYGEWLGRHVPLPYPAKSMLSGNEVWLPPPLNYAGKKFNLSKVVSMDEMGKLPKSPFRPDELMGADLGGMIAKFVKPVSVCCGNFRYQTHMNVEKCSGAGGGMNLYYSEDAYLDIKNIAYCNYVLCSSNLFGCHAVPQSSFCIHAYNSVNLSRCFEVDGCSRSSGLMFCHNCENIQDGLFCFNAKNLRNAVGNQEVGRERYIEIKKMVLAKALEELSAMKALGLDIYCLGCGGS
ncbi:MAG: hypothetical protein ACP5NX_01145 [Candidatus Bilamarchaeaceae archaeon]